MSTDEGSNYADQKLVARLNREFYRAFERLDFEAMSAVWLDDERIQCVHPGGELLRGRARVLDSWRSIFEHTTWIRFELADLAVEIHGSLAWVTNLERIHARDESSGAEALVAEAVATNLFERAAGQWHLVLHHASPIARRFGGE